MSGSWFESPVLDGDGASSLPLPPASTNPVGYITWLLENQQPVGSPNDGVSLTPDFLWLFGPSGSLTDLVATETLSVSGTVPLTDYAVTPETAVNIQSPLSRGHASFDAVGDALVASSASVQDIVTSALIVWQMRVPARPTGTMATVSKRNGLAPNEGWENAVNTSGQLIATLDGGAATTFLTLPSDITGGLPAGIWGWFALLVDAVNAQVMIASDMAMTSWSAIPAGSLSTATLLSIGAGRLQSLSMDIGAQMAFMGAQVEALFNSPTEAASATNDPSGPNIRDNVCKIFALDSSRAVVSSHLA